MGYLEIYFLTSSHRKIFWLLTSSLTELRSESVLFSFLVKEVADDEFSLFLFV